MDKNKKVFFFIDSLGGGGAERVVSVIANAFAEKYQYDFRIVMLRKCAIAYQLSDKIQLIFAEDLPIRSLYSRFIRLMYRCYKKVRQGVYKPLMIKLGKYDDLPHIDETPFYFYATYAMPYRELLKENKDCTAFGFLIRSNISMLMAAKGTGVKTVFCERNNPVRPDMPPNIIKIRDRLYSRCTSAVFQTEEEMAYYTKINGKKAVIPNPIKENLPKSFTGVRRHEIVNFCRLSPQKNITLLIDSFDMLLQDHPDYTLRVYGEGPEKENLKAYTKEKRLEEKAFIEEFASDIHERIKDAAMFVSTSDFEGLSNSMLEAMAIGLPTVCTDCDGGGARMMIQDHVNGLLVPKGNKQAVYKAMKEIIEDEVFSDKLSKNAVTLRKELSVENIVNEWKKMI